MREELKTSERRGKERERQIRLKIKNRRESCLVAITPVAREVEVIETTRGQRS
jgi:hypothetical protein